MNYLFYIFIFLLGSIIGSFLNVVICRLETGEDIVKQRSHCPKCGRILPWYDLIPIVSFFALRGRCRACQKKISWQYPLVEMATGLLFILIFNFQFSIGNLLATYFLLYVICSLIVIFVYDLRHYIIPDKILWPAIVATLLFRILNLEFVSNFEFRISNFETLLNPLFSALAAAAFFLFLVLITRGRGMGLGDVKLVFLMGLVLGWPGILMALFLAFFSGALVGIALILISGHRQPLGLAMSKNYTLQSQIPFGPFLIFGTLAALFWGQQITGFYLGLFV